MSSTIVPQTSIATGATRSRHRRGRAVGHAQSDRLRDALRTAHAPVGRAQAAMLGYAGGLVTGLLVLLVHMLGGVS